MRTTTLIIKMSFFPKAFFSEWTHCSSVQCRSFRCSPTDARIFTFNTSDILNPVCSSFSISGLSALKKPAFFAWIRTPRVPRMLIPRLLAIFLPFFSSIIKRESFFSRASAMALASPLSTSNSRSNCFCRSGTGVISIQSGNGSPNSSFTVLQLHAGRDF